MTVNKILKTVLIIISGTALIFSCSSNKPAGKVKKFQAAINSHSVESVMAFYHENVTVEFGGASSAMTEVELRPMVEWDSAVNAEVRFQILSSIGDTVTCLKVERNDWYRAFGFDSAVFDPVVMIFKEDRIRVYKQTLTKASMEAMSNAHQRFYSWAYQEQPRRLKELMPDGKPIYGAASAKKWMELLAEWRKASSL